MSSNLNKLVIGTAQFGQDYGITNIRGKVSADEVLKILSKARFHGIKTLDTARTYGNSENILGKAGIDDFDIITKLPSFESGLSSIEDFCDGSLKNSLLNLQIPSIDTVLLHRPEELLGANGPLIYRSLAGLRDKGLVRRIGISIYSPEILANIISKYPVDVVQAPLNVFDRRMISSGWLRKLIDRNIRFIARSVFLQGILLANPMDLPVYFHKWNMHFKKWKNFLQENSLSALEASLQFVVQVPEVDKVVVGVESEIQFSQIVRAMDNCTLMESKQLEINDVGLISPIDWSV
jgi:aryl-alcohol dehydrogenase-like predicted oxidoreductase